MSKSYSILFGLTADPIHLGHEQAIINGIDFLREKGFKIERFILLPVYQPNLIADKKAPVASFEQRFKMCELVANRLTIQLGCTIVVSSIEKELIESSDEKNYSFNTIRAMQSKEDCIGDEVSALAGVTSHLFMISADHFAGRWPKFRKWQKWQEILQYSGLLINQRPGHKINEKFIQQLKMINPNIYLVNGEKSIDISSSAIRNKLTSYPQNMLLADDVFYYINDNGIYCS